MEQHLKHLYQYAKFHIGMYLTIIAGVIGVFANDGTRVQYAKMLGCVEVSLVLFMLAGAAGWLVLSSVPSAE